MKVPSATYRVQLSAGFTLKDLLKIIPLLDGLGISTIYASPFFEARKGSTHGYDITDPFQINSEIGTLEQFREIHNELQRRKMNWLQDIVPNHMAYETANKWLYNVLELGPGSNFYNYFDINWQHPKKALDGKVMAPFLGDELDKVIKRSEIRLSYEQDGFSFYYYELRYPASWRSYPFVLSHCLNILKKNYSTSSDSYKSLKESYQSVDETHQDEEHWDQYKKVLYSVVHQDGAVADALNQAIEDINASPKLLGEVLDQQYFRLTYWQISEREINYRRFFTINDLICLRMEDEEVFNYYHQFIKDLCKEGLINGLRIDHIDGLFDPSGYLEKLRELVGEEFYLIIEKILEWEERLPLQWPIQGTSGYVFLAVVSNLFTSSKQEEKFTSAYHKMTPRLAEYHDLIYEKKVFILREKMGGELSNLYELMDSMLLLPEVKDGREKMIEALTAFMAAFPVYRIYPSRFPLTYRQREVLMEAYETAIKKLPKRKEALDYLLSIFMGEVDKDPAQMVYFLQRCQQFTGPLAAKGVEDTLFYIYNKLISHNEVGDSPHVFGISTQEFHENMRRRSLHFPFSLNATATHDTKRGEDARMRINALSEIPEEWFGKVQEWKEANSIVRKDKRAPDSNEEYFIYQALIGAWPQDNVIAESFVERSQAYLQKVLREAKLHSDWSAPDEEYEEAVLEFIPAILRNKPFLKTFEPFCRKIAFFGSIYSLGQCLIKITAPGIPDIYQGTELWDLSYVDPDNRRPVDYDQRLRYLEEMENTTEDYIGTLLHNYQDGRLKMYTLVQGLRERRAHQDVFNKGKYLSLEVTGKHRERIVSYGRKLGKSWYIIIAPGLLAGSLSEGQYPVGQDFWDDTAVQLPEDAPEPWVNIFTGKPLSADNKILVREALSVFPVAFLKPPADEL